jgi:hypothetical protein
MPGWIVDVVMVLGILGITYALISEGLWGAALMFFNVLFSTLIAFNFYEPLATLLSGWEAASGYADTFCLLAVFIVSLVLLRVVTESLAPAMVRFPAPVYHLGRVAFGLAGAVLTMAFIMVAFHTAPVHKKIFGAVDYKYGPPFKQALDLNWLGFFQFTSGQVFADYDEGYNDPTGEYGHAKVFDPEGRWLIDHQNARPYGKEFVPEQEGGAGAAAGGTPEAGAEGDGPPAATPPGRGGSRRGRGPAASGPGIPGGTAGAAVGLAPQN